MNLYNNQSIISMKVLSAEWDRLVNDALSDYMGGSTPTERHENILDTYIRKKAPSVDKNSKPTQDQIDKGVKYGHLLYPFGILAREGKPVYTSSRLPPIKNKNVFPTNEQFKKGVRYGDKDFPFGIKARSVNRPGGKGKKLCTTPTFKVFRFEKDETGKFGYVIDGKTNTRIKVDGKFLTTNDIIYGSGSTVATDKYGKIMLRKNYKTDKDGKTIMDRNSRFIPLDGIPDRPDPCESIPEEGDEGDDAAGDKGDDDDVADEDDVVDDDVTDDDVTDDDDDDEEERKKKEEERKKEEEEKKKRDEAEKIADSVIDKMLEHMAKNADLNKLTIPEIWDSFKRTDLGKQPNKVYAAIGKPFLDKWLNLAMAKFPALTGKILAEMAKRGLGLPNASTIVDTGISWFIPSDIAFLEFAQRSNTGDDVIRLLGDAVFNDNKYMFDPVGNKFKYDPGMLKNYTYADANVAGNYAIHPFVIHTIIFLRGTGVNIDILFDPKAIKNQESANKFAEISYNAFIRDIKDSGRSFDYNDVVLMFSIFIPCLIITGDDKVRNIKPGHFPDYFVSYLLGRLFTYLIDEYLSTMSDPNKVKMAVDIARHFASRSLLTYLNDTSNNSQNYITRIKMVRDDIETEIRNFYGEIVPNELFTVVRGLFKRYSNREPRNEVDRNFDALMTLANKVAPV